jgi:aspartyl-tRNA(Asn)/glutamyl-tRNA(Gln) amidotransferase subunit A
MAADVHALSLAALSKALRQRAISSVDATRACLDAIDEHDGTINSFIAVERDAALAQAAAADRELDSRRWRGPLHGVPLAHKDMFYRAGKVSTCGSALCVDRVATVTATVQQRMADAGAIYLGSLNMSEFAAGPTGHNAHFGHCRNPWNVRYVAGGSSSGSGAAVAARLAFGSIGSDTGGSIRLPAAMCGVVGVKPTYGLISRFGVMPRCWSLDVVGPLARTAEDCALLLQAVVGHDPRDRTTDQAAPLDYHAALAGPIAGMTICAPTNAVFADVDPDVRVNLDASLRVLEALGVRVVPVELPDPRVIYALTNLVNKAEAATIHGQWIRDRYDDYSLSAVNRIEAGFHVPATHYLDALRLRAPLLEQFADQVFAHADVVHMPVLGMPVPTVDATEIRGGTEDVPALVERITRFTRWVNYLGLPAVSVPCGFTANGLPVAYQLLGRPFAEARLLRLAHAYQQATDWHRRAPVLQATEQASA